jgi:Uma2 family endonuclease
MRTATKLTYDDYLTLPDSGPRYQLMDGNLVLSPAPNVPHQRILGLLYRTLFEFTSRNNLGETFFAPIDVVLNSENVVQPDLLFIAKNRASIVERSGIKGVPDLCVEILSPSNRELDLKAKKALYARFGVSEYWIVDPEAETVFVWRPADNANKPAATLFKSDTLASPLLPGFALDLNSVFEC